MSTEAGRDTFQTSDGASTSSTKIKRALIACACFECRKSKVRCDGKRPVCGRCSRRSLPECSFVAEEGETRFKALQKTTDSQTAKTIRQAEILDLIMRDLDEDTQRIWAQHRDGGLDSGEAFKLLKEHLDLLDEDRGQTRSNMEQCRPTHLAEDEYAPPPYLHPPSPPAQLPTLKDGPSVVIRHC